MLVFCPCSQNSPILLTWPLSSRHRLKRIIQVEDVHFWSQLVSSLLKGAHFICICLRVEQATNELVHISKCEQSKQNFYHVTPF